MKILHITAHMGDGAGKAISGLAISGSAGGSNTHGIMLLGKPQKDNHIKHCLSAGISVRDYNPERITGADIVVLNWWSGAAMERFAANFPEIPCRVAVWSHINGLVSPPLPPELVQNCDCLLATSPVTLEKFGDLRRNALVYGFGDFLPERMPFKDGYSLKNDEFVIGYVGMPSWKRLPRDFFDYCREAVRRIPNCKFIMAGEASDEFRQALSESGIAERFTLLGWVSDVAGLLLKFDVFGYLMCEDTSATTENSVLEALAAGVPAVVSRKPIGKYLFDDGVSGFLTDSPEDYGGILARLYADGQLRTRIGKAGREHAIRVYRADENLNRFNTACESIMQKPKTIHKLMKEKNNGES